MAARRWPPAAPADCGPGHDGPLCNCFAATTAAQSLDELGFARSACQAAAAGQLEKLGRILDRAPDSVHSDGGKGTSGYTPLHYGRRPATAALRSRAPRGAGDAAPLLNNFRSSRGFRCAGHDCLPQAARPLAAASLSWLDQPGGSTPLAPAPASVPPLHVCAAPRLPRAAPAQPQPPPQPPPLASHGGRLCCCCCCCLCGSAHLRASPPPPPSGTAAAKAAHGDGERAAARGPRSSRTSAGRPLPFIVADALRLPPRRLPLVSPCPL
ncbi:MAG: hypothetical protein J3K34DRAFT_120450 [Monoraphidium minutum]|nr:MAG: hypothetical protein J3K34DRAFT_120450 [Monoraphidium minutum]